MKKAIMVIRQLMGEYLTYNRSEQRGIFILCLILLVLVITNAVIPSGTGFMQQDYSKFQQEVDAFEAAWKMAADSDSMARAARYSGRSYSYVRNGQDSSRRPVFPVKEVLVIELNSADTFDLQQLRGIGPAFARRIVSYRERLGGFCDKKQLLEVFGMDSLRFLDLRDHVTVNSDSVHRIDINTVTFKELLRHPYFPFALTKNIMLYRQKQKVIKNLEEINKVEGISDSLFSRMVVYLRVGP